MDNKTLKQKKQSIILKNFTILEKNLLILLEIMLTSCLMLAKKQNRMEQNKKNENREQQDLKYYLLKKCFKDC